MAKVQLKSDKITPFGGLFSINHQFNVSGLRSVIDSHLGRRSNDPKAYSHSDVFTSIFSSYLCGGDCLEDVMNLRPFWNGHKEFRLASSDTIGRTLRKLSEDNITYKSDAGKEYLFNVANNMNSLLLKCLKTTGQLHKGDCIDLDFDHQFISAEKKDAKFSYKQHFGYFPGVATSNGLIVGIENRDGNANVRFHQADTLERIFRRLEGEAGVMVRNFRADCGSFSEDIISCVAAHCEHFYLRASSCESRRTEFMEHKEWEQVQIGELECGVASFGIVMANENYRLVVQRSINNDKQAASETLFGKDYIYRAVITNDWSNSEKSVIEYYNLRGASERNFDCQNNDFGWSHLPFSFLKENTVFLLVTAILKNFYLYLLSIICPKMKKLDPSCRLKRFIRWFVSVPAKWTRSSRMNILNLYTKEQVYLLI